MKKLIAMIGAAVLGASAWATTYGGGQKYIVPADFEAGPTNIVGYSDDAQTSVFDTLGCVFWFANNFPTTKAGLTDYEQPAEVAVDETLGEKVLKIEADTAAPMLRTFNPTQATQIGDADEYSFASEAQPIGDLGLFADTKIKLSASEDVPQDFTGKLAVWLHAVPAEEGVTEGFTNLMVTCGQLDSEFEVGDTPTNIAIAADGVTVKPEEWHRITIRSIKELATGKTVPGFVIYVDGVLAQAADGAYELPSGLTGKAAEFAGKNALFASASSDVDTAQKLESVGFAGNGSLNYIDLTDMVNAPIFAQDPTDVVLTWDDYVVGVKIGDKTLTDTEVEAGKFAYRVTAFGTPVAVELTLNELYKIKGITPTGLPIEIDEEDNTKFTFTPGQSFDDSQAVAITTVEKREGAKLYVDDAEVGTVHPFVKDAVDALIKLPSGYTTAKIVLQLDETAITDFGDWSSLGGDVILDLNGKTIAVDATKDWKGGTVEDAIVRCMIKNTNEASITVTNSAASAAQMIGTDNVWLVYNANGHMDLADAAIKYNGMIYSANSADDNLYGTMTIFGGKFIDSGEGAPKVTLVGEDNGLSEDPKKVWSDAADGDDFWAVVDYVPPAGTVIIITEGGVTNGWYETLAAAFEAAVDNDKIVLLANAELDDWITTDKKVTLDLAGFTVSPSASFVGYPNDTLFGVKRGGVLTVDDSSENGTGTITTGDNTTMWGCAKVTIKGEDATGNPATIIVNGGNFVGRRGAICAHGDRRGGYITINGGTFSCLSEGSNVDAAIYFPAEGALTITGGSFTGKTGVYAKSGTVNITGGTFASIAASWDDYAPYNNGVNGAGAALVLEKLLPNEGGYADNLVCTVTGGTFDAPIYSFARQGSETLVGFIGSDVLVKDTITTPVEYIANTPAAGYRNAWVDSTTNPGYKTPGAEAIEYTITFATDRGDKPTDMTYKVTDNFPIKLPTIDLSGATFKGWTNETYKSAITELAKPAVLDDIVLVAEWEQLTGEPAKVLSNDVEGEIPADKKDQATANATALVNAKGDEAGVAAWVKTVYGEGGKIPADKIANASAENVALAVAFDVPVMVEPTISAPVVAEKTTGPAAFEFAIKDGATEVEIKTLTDNVKKIVKYAAALGGTNTFGPAKDTEVAIGLDEGKIKAEFVPGPTAGFMRADFAK